MKNLHRTDLRSWSAFDVERDIDFNAVAWIREGSNVLFDPLPMSQSDLAQLRELGGAARIVVTNSDHTRASEDLAKVFGAVLYGPRAEQSGFPIACDEWLGEGDEIVPGLRVLELHGSKTPGELALLLDDSTLITGDLVRGQRGGSLNLLPEPKLSDPAAANASVARLAGLPGIDAVLVGDGWPIFDGGSLALRKLCT